MSARAHRIRRQRWSVRAETLGQALEVRRWLRDTGATTLNDALTAAFDAVVPGDGIVRLHRVEVNVRVRQMEDLLETLPPRVVDALCARVTDCSVTAVGSAEDADAALLDYLLTGRVRWPERPDGGATISGLEERARASAMRTVAAVAVRATDARGLADAMFRLLQLVDEREWIDLVDAAARHSRWSAAAERSPSDRPSMSAGPRDRRLRLVVSRVSGAPADSSSDSERVEARERPPTGTDSSSAISPVSSRDRDGVPHSPQRAQASPRSRQALVDAMLTGGLVVPHHDEPVPGPGEESGFAEAVSCAGLVLVHPFLPQLFRAAGLDATREWDPSLPHTARAAALLHFVATGDDEPYELQLGTVKIVLGLTPDTPLPVAGGLLTAADRSEAHDMLAAVVDHWQALKRTSVPALRTSFLQRPGLIKRDENGWRLAVEPAPFDVMLARLPWTLSVVKLPWMRIPIHVEWTTR